MDSRLVVGALRRDLKEQLFPGGIPALWCPLLTHFRAAGEPDAERIAAHLENLAPFVKGILVPGSTSEGWELTDSDIEKLLSIVLEISERLQVKVLIGVLKTTTDEVLTCLDTLEPLRTHPAVAGVTVCGARGAEKCQTELHEGLTAVLERGWPTALYQLPQVTQNELSPETVAALAQSHANFLFFKDTSGTDTVAQSGLDLGGVFRVRGAEKGGYAGWTHSHGGPYDGFLLSTANVFAPQLTDVLQSSPEQARVLSQRLETVVTAAFALVADLPMGNAFANANKALDHCLAHGERALQVEPPLLYSGARLPSGVIQASAALLTAHGLLPSKGYLSGAPTA